MASGKGVAVVGCGLWGQNLVRNFKQLNYLIMACDIDPTAIARARHIAPDCQMVSNFEAVLRSDVAGVVVATPAETHYDLARQVIEANKHVFVEKPMALTCRQGTKLVELAEKAGLVLMVGHVLEYHPAIRKLYQMIADASLGEIRYIYSNRLNLGRVRRNENVLWSFAPHDIAILLRLAGMPIKVVATGDRHATVTNFTFKNNITGHVFVSWLHPFKEQRLVIIGTEGMISFDDVEKRLTLCRESGENTEIRFSQKEPLRLECQAFLRAIDTGRPPLTDGESGLRVLQVLEKAQQSL